VNLFSHCILTASDEPQATAFRTLLDRRLAHGLYPREISFHVYPDPPGRVGSGGGTLWALHRLYQDLGLNPATDLARPDAPSVLILHAAGESRRLPVFAPEGKLFAPVPVSSSSVIPPVVLDLQLALYLRFPWSPGQVVVGSGDVIIDFDTEGLGGFDAPITGFATPAGFEQGSRHGVFAFDAEFRRLKDYFQKQPAAFLTEHAVIEGTDSCALDIGIVAMRPDYVSALFALAGERAGGETILVSIAHGKLSFGLYLEQLLASLSIPQDEYRRRLAGVSALSPDHQELFFKRLHDLPLGGHLARRCTFLHFGSVAEFPAAAARVAASGMKPFYTQFDTQELLPDLHAGVVMNSVATELASSSGTAGGAIADACLSVHLEYAGRCIISGLENASGLRVPDGFCLDARRTAGGTVTAVYHREDSFRPAALSVLRFCGTLLTDWLSVRGLSLTDLGLSGDSSDATAVDLYDLPLFMPGATGSTLAGYVSLPDDPVAWAAAFRNSTRLSLRALNSVTDVTVRDARRQELRTKALAAQLDAGRGWRTASSKDVAAAVAAGTDPAQLAEKARATVDPVLRLYRSATLAAATAAGGTVETPGARQQLHFLRQGRWRVAARAVKSDQIVWARSPVRLDLAGGWTDTPPYTNLFGGAVTNLAVDLNGQPPIQVFVRPVAEPHIIFHSIDLGEREVLTRVSELTSYTDPASRFALPRAACTLLGLGAADEDLTTTLTTLGGGFELSLLAAVPKGSGLGTSSVLGAVILSALFRFFGLTASPDELFLSVLELEQMLTTGGGWQDQIGGIAGGVKYIETRPGAQPQPLVHQLDPWLFEEPEYAGRMTLYYTGVTRLAKNILQEVVGRVNAREPAFLFTHDHLRSLASQARSAIALRDYPALCRVVQGSWKGNRLIHPSTSNEEIDTLLAATAVSWRAVKLLGAGGGGYALFMSESRAQADALRASLETHAQQSPAARLVDFSLSRVGLQVSVS
jgi:galactokinase/mevalonate kinase-like predicted kinase